MNSKYPLHVLHIRLYQHFINFSILPLLVIIFALLLPTVSAAQDSDGDGVDDTKDNCIEIANLDQRDSDGDGFGNICDADFDNTGFVNLDDFDLFVSYFGTNNPHADFDSTGFVNLDDFDLFVGLFGKPPGPAGSNGSISKVDAARFLTQTTFGPTLQAIDQLVATGSYEDWLEEQFEKPISSQFDTFEALWLKTCLEKPGGGYYNSFDDLIVQGGPYIDHNVEGLRIWSWWNVVIDNPDQLRQRVALALSEILVVSSVSPLAASSFGLTDYYDVLIKHSFGNYRDLLEEVTLHPMMGSYLSMLRNEKADPERNTRPDENYARELMQLFTIGVHELEISGELKRSSDDKPIPTYTQTDIEEFSKVFTGWNFSNFTQWDFYYLSHGHTTVPMKAWPEFHDSSSKNLLNGTVLPAGQTAEKDLQDALDNIFAHPNVGPFISKQLIQRLVTSNPSKDYVQRVAQVFNDNGFGTKGDLKAVVKAILLDQEARTGHLTIPNFGKLREPLLRISHLRRAFDATKVARRLDPGDECGRGDYHVYNMAGFNGQNFLNWHGQQFLQSPTVFNFFRPDFSPSGSLQNAGLVAPEFQIVTESTLVKLANSINQELQTSATDISSRDYISRYQITREAALATDHNKLLDHLDLLLLNGQMSTQLRQALLTHLDNDAYSDDQTGLNNKAKDAIMLIVMSPDYLIQK